MPFRNPRYLDLPALQNVADYYDIPLPEERQVTRTTSSNRGGRAGISHGIEAGLERGSAEEVVEAYSVQPRPVRAMNDVVDQLLSAAQLIDLTSDAEQAIAQGAVLQIEGELHLSPVTELGAIMAASLPGLIARAAANPNVYAKVSGLYPLTGDQRAWGPADLRPFVDHAFGVFGADRLMFGSDWPVSIHAGDYETVWTGLDALFAELTPSERAAVTRDTAIRFYGLAV